MTARIKVADATSIVLDWMVAKVEGNVITFDSEGAADGQWEMYSTNWSQGGPIIEREGISISRHPDGANWMAWIKNIGTTREGPTPLIAAMRCFCCAKLGDEINILEELCPQQPT